jgi:hypothetical protein
MFRLSGLSATAEAQGVVVRLEVTPKTQVVGVVAEAQWRGPVFPPMLCLPLWMLLLAHPLMVVVLKQQEPQGIIRRFTFQATTLTTTMLQAGCF